MTVLMIPAAVGDSDLAARMAATARVIVATMMSVVEDTRVQQMCDEYDRCEADRDIPRWWMGE